MSDSKSPGKEVQSDMGSNASFLPHGPSLRLITTPGVERGEWREFEAVLTADLSIVEYDSHCGVGRASAEAGLEFMAQACGMLAAVIPGAVPTVFGVVGAVRGYEYETRDFLVGDVLRARVKPAMIEQELIVCECELSVAGEEAVRQRARITVILQGESAR